MESDIYTSICLSFLPSDECHWLPLAVDQFFESRFVGGWPELYMQCERGKSKLTGYFPDDCFNFQY